MPKRPDIFIFSLVHVSLVDPAIRRIAVAGISLVGFVNPIAAVPSVSDVGPPWPICSAVKLTCCLKVSELLTLTLKVARFARWR